MWAKSVKLGWWLAAGLLSFAILGSGLAQAALTKPVFKVQNGDVFAGGWFNNQQDACNAGDTANYQAPTYSTSTRTYNPVASQYLGGIMTFNKLSGGKPTGAAADFGALAMGLIEGNPAGDYGFASGLSDDNNSLSFANSSSVANYWGGLLAGTVPQTHCIPDYYNTKQNSPAAWSGSLDSAASGQYKVAASGTIFSLNTTPQTIKAGKNLTIFVEGDAYIGANISYDNGNYTAINTPHFALVVLGNIFIDPDVSNLDGLYIAQPDTSSQATTDGSGAIWSCHAKSPSVPTPNYLYSNCDKKLTVNGAMIAKQLALVRTNGDVGNNNVAETINYIPEMVIGGPFFNFSSSGNDLKIESLISLPPIF